MGDRIEIVYTALDEMASEILQNRIAMRPKNLDPNRPGEPCSWPETFLAWKEKVLRAEDAFGRQPLTVFQWFAIEKYMVNQYGFSPIPEEVKT